MPVFLISNVCQTQLTNASSPPLTSKTSNLPPCFHPSSPPRPLCRTVSLQARALHLPHIEHPADRCACGPLVQASDYQGVLHRVFNGPCRMISTRRAG